MEGLDKTLEAAGKLLEVAPELYNDTIQPTAIEIGKTGSLIWRAINAALAPLEKWVLDKEYNMAETKKLLGYKLEHLDPSKIVEPDAYVAVPALQAIPYCMDSEVLRNMFANLLANAMNIDNKSDVHPSFVEIIKQLSPYDAETIRLFLNSQNYSLPIAKYIGVLLTEEQILIRDNIMRPLKDINDPIDKYESMSIVNLVRLGILEIDYTDNINTTNHFFSEYLECQDFFYQALDDIIHMHQTVEEFPFPEYINELNLVDEILIHPGIVRITSFGLQFVHVCCS